MSEEWKDIEEYEGLYQVSSMGRVKSLNYNHTNKERILKTGKDKYGYLFVYLYKDGKRKFHKVHRLVAQAFLDNPYNLPFINHKDECKTNNFVDNIEWCTAAYNINYGTRNAKAGKTISKTNTNGERSKPVVAIDPETGKVVIEFPSTAEAGRNGFDYSAVGKCCRREKYYKTHKGFIWRYKNETTV